ncbi:DUF1631 family protein [Chitinilyticum piscinae]|uniref:DUF1631 domain-containing protein n=1 Tax=Chitinilyticum piscinae TaxID=2866724 RepID=A0A8J7FKM3_9NEIS|nr:DUF1631 family protein [Chitinilyticum piscinae]MBE9609477.1 DUF1631 domain-containing protein [Chitinilyticum piscinae]
MSIPNTQSSNRSAAASAGFAADPTLAACRDLAIQLLGQSLDGFFIRLEQTYLDLADKTHDRALRDTYFAARAEMQRKRAVLAEEFRQRFIAAFNARMQHAQSQQAKSDFYKVKAPETTLSLVANDEYEENLSATNLAQVLKNNGGEELTQLEQRFASLISPDEASANPMSPEAICEAFLTACRQLESGLDARLVALKAFERELAGQVAQVYRSVNQFLIQQHVEPVSVRPKNPQRPPSRPVVQQTATSGQEASQAAPARSAEQGATLPVHVTEELAAHFTALQQQAEDEGAPEALHAQPAPQWLEFLSALQKRNPLQGKAAPEGDAVADPLAGRNMVAMLRSTQWAKKLSQVDGMTLDLVALLFEHMFNDSRLPVTVKGLIGRLQIPVLKVSMLDGSFFSRKNHPARRLLDCIADAALDAPDKMEAGDQRFEKLATVVAWVVAKFDDNVEVFELALQELESYLAAELKNVEASTASTTSELLDNEVSELGRATADTLVRVRLSTQELPILVADFLARHWRPALAHAYGPQGEEEPLFAARVRAMDQLIWSVQPKSGAEERLQLVNVLPDMLKTLEDGSRAAGSSDEECKAFFAELVHCHAAAIRAGLKPQTPATVDLAAPAIQEQVALLPAPEPVPALQPVPQDLLPERGEWVEFLLDGEAQPQRLRVSWISPQGTRFLLTNRSGGNGKTLLRHEMHAAIRKGLIRRLNADGSLTDRAIDSVRQVLEV